ncbi:MAG TPA: TIM barrel protein [Terriglobales bacterium]|nr:TIM barrel protein [Terriglobales bacterium]
MNRREFSRTAAKAVFAASLAPAVSRFEAGATPNEQAVPRLSVMLWTVFRKLPFEQRLEKVAEAGYRAVELVDEFRNWQPADFTRAAAVRRSLGITVDATAGLATGIADPAGRSKFLDELGKMLPLMEKLECRSLIVLSGNVAPGLSREAQHQSCIEGLQRAADMAAPHGVSLLLENIDPEENPKYYLTSSREGFEIVRSVNRSNVRFLYDLYHEQIAEGNLLATLERNFAHLGLVHVADVPGRHQPGTGEINYGNVFRKLAQLQYGGYMAMEFLPQGEPLATLRAARDLAIRSWHEPFPGASRSKT